MDINACISCSSTDFRYDDEHCRNICNICNTWQEITGMGVTNFYDDPNVKIDRLKTYTLSKKLKLTKEDKEKQQMHVYNTQPYKLRDLFEWLYEKQAESLYPYVVNVNEFKQLTRSIWNKYMVATGEEFDVLTASNDDIRMQKYPIGWGSIYDPKTGCNSLKKATREFRKLRREAKGSNDDYSENDEEKVERNYKKIRIERMVHSKRVEKEAEQQMTVLLNQKPEIDGDIEKKCIEKDVIKAEEVFEPTDKSGSESSDEESIISDEDDPSYLQLDYMDEAEREKVRIMRKKRPHEVQWNGSYCISTARLMENNVTMLFLAIHYCRDKSPKCLGLVDLLSLIQRRIVPYIGVLRFIPSDRFYVNDKSYQAYLRRDDAPSWKCMTECFSKTLVDLRLNFVVRQDLSPFIERTLADLNLPSELKNVIDYFRTLTEKIKLKGQLESSNLIRMNNRYLRNKYFHTLLPEPLVLAYVFLALRSLLKLDGKYEVEASDLARQHENWFVWTDWWRQTVRPASVSQVTSWYDCERAAFDVHSFLENRDQIENNDDRFSELGLVWNRDINRRGRPELPKKPKTQQDVRDQLEAPLRAVLNGISHLGRGNMDREHKFIDFTQSSIRYLYDNNCETISSHPAFKVLERISIPTLTSDLNVFHPDFESNTTQIENDLLHTLTRGTGIKIKNVLHHHIILEKSIFPKASKTKKPRKRKIVS